MRNTLIVLSVLAAVLVSSMIFSGCGEMKLEGTQLSNQPPTVEWALIPQDSTRHSRNPELQWVGKDVDGQLLNMDFQYTVVLKDDADNLGGPAAMAADFPSDIEWTSLGYATSAVIPLYASSDTSVYVDQYVFLRCLDDRGAESNIIYLFLSRNNHPPTCSLIAPGGPLWCLPDTSDYWHGIRVSWAGKDSIDYPGFIQPDFIWNTRIYGPFADSALADTLPADYLYTIADLETGDTLTALEDWTFTDLETGWYMVYTRNFDDAFVPAVPALGYLNVYEPNWIRHPADTKDILLVNRTTTYGFFANPAAIYSDSVRIFYEDLLAGAGITSDKWDVTTGTPTIADLYMYRMVMVDDIDWNQDVNQSTQEPLARYLDVGGRLWVLGRMSFFNTSTYEGRYDYGANSTTEPLPYTYIGLNAAVFPVYSFDNAEFVGAQSINTAFPSLEVEPSRIAGLTPYPPGGDPYTALPKVEYLIRTVNSETVYRFVSNNPDTSMFHGFPVAVRNETEVFKASYFSFPLFMIKTNQAQQVANTMLAWFLDQ